MKLLVILLCLLSERFLIHSVSYQRFYWFPDYCQKIKMITNKHGSNPWVLLTLIIVPIVLLVSIIYLLLDHLVFGLIGFLLSLIIFFYCLGPQNVFYPIVQSDIKTNQELVGDYFILVNRQLFSLVFWYIIAGPIGALAYRLITLCRDFNYTSVQANEIADLLEWIPARLTVLLFLLVGNFQRGFSSFTSYFFAKPDMNNDMLRIGGLLAVRTNETEEIPMPEAESLVEHAIVVMLVFIALFTLITWL
ncbi:MULTISPECIES: regulatory signaling modulator protein AmpE [Legionella]|uniref:Regulatory signaling modulator protein AmpE n=1 Tax=Legionella resiliens TaxID=2905958 RepID=A0ABS8X2P1_9GAMM|nr:MULTISPECIES: regulatory signaling modulator protein AmpE [unclassified Legionella]MCE0723874.1 regulatory signaling modulator protein AmpE [Legionella sp. 9fVS26]MCE3533026.1 regulatory signaling modulator protein AmpE [Legionella sp. 8cVS16]QLZ69219.1 membrane protein [Legionella sp. PC1000]